MSATLSRAVFLGLLCLPGLAAAAEAPARVLPFEPTVDTLPNGLRVVTVRIGAEGIIAYYTVVRAGSRDEVVRGRSGFAHFFEHMMFRGTEKHPSAEYGATLARLGADNNAYTTEDYTAYHTIAPASALERVAELESDRFMRLDYSEAGFKTEAGAVLGEYNTSASNPDMKMWEAICGAAFDAHPYGHTVMGYLADVQAMPTGFDYSRQFFRDFYTPDNSTVIVVGDVDREKVLEVVRRYYGGWTGTYRPADVPVEPEPTGPRARHLDWPSPTPPRLTVGWRVPGLSVESTDSAAILVAAELLFGETSPLYARLVLEEQRVLSISTNAEWASRDPHLFQVELKFVTPADRDALGDDLQDAADALARGEVDAGRLEAVKSHARYERLLGLETAGRTAGYLADVIGRTGEVAHAEQMLQRIGEVTAADVTRVASKYLRPARRTTVSLAHNGKEAAK